ncbi:hypothetical protein C0Q70_04420 [Pomacea canaliculata]|uniref:Uncharacterized protein n=1 Tax=Pomacea canaliculata TaxID=400727 RepID=A0A2T7PIB6_POMCA|nr:hypothetical protein C0Q70_04420 [Pomacea canaliculata]
MLLGDQHKPPGPGTTATMRNDNFSEKLAHSATRQTVSEKGMETTSQGHRWLQTFFPNPEATPAPGCPGLEYTRVSGQLDVSWTTTAARRGVCSTKTSCEEPELSALGTQDKRFRRQA